MAQGLDVNRVTRLYDLVMVTRHDALPQTQDAKLLVDIDLGILGASPRRNLARSRAALS